MRFTSRIACGLITTAFVSLSGCSKQSADTEPAPEPAPAIAVTTPPPSTSTPAPAAPARTTPAPVVKRLAPEGTFYLLVKKSIETSDGIIGFKPGTLVKQESDGRFTAEGHKLDIQPNEITNELDIAARYAGADALRQATLRQASASVAAPSAAAPASTPAPASRQSGPSVVPSQRSASALDTSSALGSSHSMARDGWLWQKDETGNWKRVKPLR
jgi:hypothetical protein